MRRRVFLSAAALLPAAPVAAQAQGYAAPFPAYNTESFWDIQESGASLALIVAQGGCTNTAGLDAARRALHTAAGAGRVEALEARWEDAQAGLVEDGELPVRLDEVRVLVYRDGRLAHRFEAPGDAAAAAQQLAACV